MPLLSVFKCSLLSTFFEEVFFKIPSDVYIILYDIQTFIEIRKRKMYVTLYSNIVEIFSYREGMRYFYKKPCIYFVSIQDNLRRERKIITLELNIFVISRVHKKRGKKRTLINTKIRFSFSLIPLYCIYEIFRYYPCLQ